MPPKVNQRRRSVKGSGFEPINRPSSWDWDENSGTFSIRRPSEHVDDYSQAVVARDPDVQGLVFSSYLPDRVEEPGDIDPSQFQIQPYNGIRPRPAVRSTGRPTTRVMIDPRVQPYPDTRAMLATSALDLAGGALSAGTGLAGLGLGAAAGGLGLAANGIGTGVGALARGVGSVLGGAGEFLSGSASAIKNGVAGAIQGAGDAAAGIVAAYKEHHNEALEKTAREAIQERQNALDKLEKQNKLYREVTRELNRLQNENQANSQKQINLETKLQQANARISLLNQATANASVQLEQAKAQIRAIKIEANKRIGEAEDFSKNLYNQANQELYNKNAETQVQKQQLAALENERSNLQTLNDQLIQQSRELEREKTQLNEQLAQINASNQARTARINQLMAEHTQLSLDKEELSRQLDYLQAMVEQQHSEIKKLNARPMVQNIVVPPPPVEEIQPQPVIRPIENTRVIKVVVTPEKPYLGIVKNPVFFETFNPRATQRLKPRRKTKRKVTRLYNKIQGL